MNPKNIKSLQKNKVAQAELMRAHGMIVLLALGFALFLVLHLYGPVLISPVLAIITAILLAVVGLVSASIVWRIKSLN